MVILMLPHTGKVKMRGESNFLLFEDMAKYFVNKGDLVFFCVPEWANETDLLYKHKNLIYVRMKYTKYFYTDMYLFNQDIFLKFNRRVGGGMIDLVITSKLYITTFFVSGLDGSQVSIEVPVIYYEPGILDKRDKLNCRNKLNANMIIIAMSYCSGYCVFLTKNEYNIAKELVKKCVSGIALKRFVDRSRVIPVGIPEVVKSKKNDQFTVFYGARANKVKNINMIIKLYNKFYSSGRKIKIVISTSTSQILAERYIGKKNLVENKNLELFVDMNRREYMTLAKKGHVFVAMSKNEGFPVGFWEQMKMDLVGVFPDRKWAISQLPKNYPFIFKNTNEAYTILSFVYDNYKKALKMMKDSGIKNMIRQYSTVNVYGSVRNYALKLNEEYRKRTDVKSFYSGLVPVFNEALKRMDDSFEISEFIKVMAKLSKSMSASVKGRTFYRYPTNYNIYIELEKNGYKLDSLKEVDNEYKYYFKKVEN